jgi:hypothetical protein
MLTCGALLLEVALDRHQLVALLLKGSGELLGLPSLLLGLGETGLHLLKGLAFMMRLSLSLREHCFLQRKLGLDLVERYVLPLKLVLLILQRGAKLLDLIGLLLGHGQVGVVLNSARLQLVQPQAKTLHLRGQLLILPLHIRKLSVQVGDVRDLRPDLRP